MSHPSDVEYTGESSTTAVCGACGQQPGRPATQARLHQAFHHAHARRVPQPIRPCTEASRASGAWPHSTGFAVHQPEACGSGTLGQPQVRGVPCGRNCPRTVPALTAGHAKQSRRLRPSPDLWPCPGPCWWCWCAQACCQRATTAGLTREEAPPQEARRRPQRLRQAGEHSLHRHRRLQASPSSPLCRVSQEHTACVTQAPTQSGSGVPVLTNKVA